MPDCRARALVLLEIAEEADRPEHKSQALAVAQLWLTFAAIDEALTVWREQVESEAMQ
jgi:hypothetical protein